MKGRLRWLYLILWLNDERLPTIVSLAIYPGTNEKGRSQTGWEAIRKDLEEIGALGTGVKNEASELIGMGNQATWY